LTSPHRLPLLLLLTPPPAILLCRPPPLPLITAIIAGATTTTKMSTSNIHLVEHWVIHQRGEVEDNGVWMAIL
jgi:hypothetical protein